MSSRDRVRLAFAHEEPDRVPLFEIHVDTKPASEILGHWAPIGYSGATSKFQTEMAMAGKVEEFQEIHMNGRLELIRAVGQDVLRAFPFRVDAPKPERITDDLWRFPYVVDGHALNVWCADKKKQREYWSTYKFVEETDSWIEVDSSVAHGGMQQFEQMLQDLEERGPSMDGISFRNIEWALQTAPDICVMGWADIPFFPGNSWTSIFFEAMAGRPDLMDRWFAAQRKQILLMLEEQLKRGANLILGGQDFCDTRGPTISPRHYRRWFQPFLLEITALCHRYGVPYLRHNDGKPGILEETFLLESGIDGWHAIEPNAGNDIFYFKKKYGDRITLAGNVDCAVTLVTGTPEEVYNEARDKILGCAPGGGYMLSSSNTIHNGVPARNYLAMVAAWRDFGNYPIRKRE